MSQRVWTCACGWKSTAENVERKNGSFGQGEAPATCRRCGRTALTVASEKHPKVTIVCKDPDCGQDFIGWPGAKYCKRCMPKHRGSKAWDGRRKYVWTPERDQILRDHYRSNATAIATRFFPGWQKWVITHRAQQLGLCRTKEKPWTKAEDAFLLEHVGVHTAQWMQRQLRTRTVTAIIVRLKRLHISRRIQADGMTMRQLEQALGVDHRQIVAWWRSGRLKGSYRSNPNEHERYEFQEPDIAEFLLNNPTAFRLDRVDQAWFMTLIQEAVRGTWRHTSPAAATSASPTPRQPKTRAAAAPAQPKGALTACIGVGEQTPCALHKQVAERPGIPARCPDCRLELRRRLQRQEMARLQRIKASAPPNAERVERSA